MLKGIPSILSPELVKALLEMGHGDELVIADGNFPAATCGKRLLRADGHGVPELLDAILQLFPLDTTYSEYSVALMQVEPNDPTEPTIWKEYESIIQKHDTKFKEFAFENRFDFYERAKVAFAVLATGESALYANIIIKKGVVTE
ncbi:RbsD/FucU family protein [Salirhabdus sp. Marseille-P4669]|uniref:RbsD/FucU family protein n=1 Tax=Salirhabdus sp. Marseille-P4669 TaxID=2042310 RepID=UPI000C7C726A|nr:RbsD/FucU domain-containing protein [Salirhabdus sp. Marseille-P4669]